MIRLEGILIPTRWDKNGKIVALAIATNDEDEYFVENRDQVKRLKPLLRQAVEVNGIIGNKGGKKIIHIKKINKKNEQNYAKSIE